MSNFRNGIAATGVAVGLLMGTSACGEQGPAPRHETELTIEELVKTGHVVFVSPGETVIVPPTDDISMAEDLQTVDHQYSHGFEDEMAPEVAGDPISIDGHVSLSGSKSNYLDNDLGCDTVNLDLGRFDDPTKVYIGAIAISKDADDPVMVSWPKVEGQPAEQAYVCFDEDNEPSDGVILFADDTQR